MRKIFVVCGPSAVGKTTLYKAIKIAKPEIHYPVSLTTRPQGEGEVDGVDYHFKTVDQFERLINRNAFAEWARGHHDNLYGTLKVDLDPAKRQSGTDVLLEINFEGMLILREKHVNLVTIFILPPSFKALEVRIRERRRGESETEIAERLATARRELAVASKFDHRVLNANVDKALRALTAIIDLHQPVMA